MEDKLEKYGHKMTYYKLKNIAVILVALIMVVAILAIPVGVSIRLSAAATTNETNSEILSSCIRLLTNKYF